MEARLARSLNGPDASHPPESVQFRPGRVSLTPYVKVPLPKEAVKELMIGPSVYPTHQRRAVTRMLRDIIGLQSTGNGRLEDAVRVRNSAAPYR